MASPTYIPPPQDEMTQKAQRLMQMGLALKQQKQQEAQQSIEMGFKLMDMGIDPDYGKMTQAAKALGYPIPSDVSQWQASRTQMTPTPNVSPNQAAKTGSAQQNLAGAQSGTPPSKSAAQKAPGGGVQKPVGAAPTQMLQQAVAGTMPGQGGEAPQTGQPQAQQGPQNAFAAFTENRRQQMALASEVSVAEARAKMSSAALHEKVTRLGTATPYEIGIWYADNNMPLTVDQHGWYNANPEQRKQIIDISAGAESDASKAARKTQATTSLINSGQLMDIVSDPKDIPELAEAIASGNPVPKGIGTQPNISRKVKEAELLTKYASILPMKYATQMAQIGANGGDPMSAIPMDEQGTIKSLLEEQLTIQQRQVTAQELQANAAWQSAQASWAAAEAEARVDPILAQQLKVLDGWATAGKLGVDVDKDIVNQTINDIAERLGMQQVQKRGMFKSFFRTLFGSNEYGRPGATGEQMQEVTGNQEAYRNPTEAELGPEAKPRSMKEIRQTGPQNDAEYELMVDDAMKQNTQTERKMKGVGVSGKW